MIDRIILIGPMGAGKSTIGRLLSDRLSLDFIDSDREIETRLGADIPWIFDIEGEAGFRVRESQVIAELLAAPGQVIATGGGAILSDENRKNLRAAGVVIYLKTSVAQQLQRTAKDKNRPLLQHPNPEAVLQKLAVTRNPLYEKTADICIETDGLNPPIVVQMIINRLNAL